MHGSLTPYNKLSRPQFEIDMFIYIYIYVNVWKTSKSVTEFTTCRKVIEGVYPLVWCLAVAERAQMVTKEGRKGVKIPLKIMYNNEATRNYMPTHEGCILLSFLLAFLLSHTYIYIYLYPEWCLLHY